MVSETEAIAELSCTREYPSLIHYAARYGQVTVSASLTHPIVNVAGPTAPASTVCEWDGVSLQEKVLLWLLQFMQEQAISLDEVDQNGNTAVHVAAQYGHLTCIQVCEVGKNPVHLRLLREAQTLSVWSVSCWPACLAVWILIQFIIFLCQITTRDTQWKAWNKLYIENDCSESSH